MSQQECEDLIRRVLPAAPAAPAASEPVRKATKARTKA